MASSPEPNPPDSQPRQEQGLEQLKIANYYLRVALDQIPEGIVLLETGPLEGTGPKVIFSNAPAACLMGADPTKGLRGLHLADLVTSEAEARAMLATLLSAAEGGSAECECECALQTFYGTGPKMCRWTVRAVFSSMKKLLNFTIAIAPVAAPAENSAVQHAPKKIHDLDAQSEQLRTENLAALAKGIAHDVNNLLGPIAIRISDIVQKLPQDSPLVSELSLAYAGISRAKQFTSQIVKASKAKSGKSEPTDLSCLIRDTVQLSQAGANVSVRVHVPEDIDWAVADSVKVSQVLQNLIMNGIQAMPHGGYMDVEAKNLTIAPGKDMILQPGRYTEIIVRDRGTGIAPENLERLFHEVFTTKADGNGIGLTTCKRFVEDHGGDIRVTSKVGVGTEFRVLLPSIARPATHSAIPAAPVKPAALVRGEGTVLIVDDEDDLRRIAGTVLQRCGYRVYGCDNGQEAAEIYRNLARAGERPDVVFMDLTLRGGMSGAETLHEILCFDRSARVVLTSGSVTEDVQVGYLDQGFIDILSKPYGAGELSQMARKITTVNAVGVES